MDNYRYILDKSSKKFICPRCQKKRFVKFIDTTNGNYLADEFGRCDRKQSCGHFQPPPKVKKYYQIEFLSIESITDKAVKAIDKNAVIHFIPKSQILEQEDNNVYLSEWYLEKENFIYSNCPVKEITDESVVNTIIKAPSQAENKPSYHHPELIDKFFVKNPVSDHFSTFLKSFFNLKDYERVKKDYRITGTNLKWNHSTIFWQIDEDKNIRCAKLMLYDPDTGKRIKKPYNHINWLHSAMKLKDFHIDQCLFGLHLSQEQPDKDVAIVESEKTAIIMSIVMPDFIWMATGGSGNLNLEKLKPIKQRNIILYPDKGEFENWQAVEQEAKKTKFKISTSDILEHTDLPSGKDLADYFLLTYDPIKETNCEQPEQVKSETNESDDIRKRIEANRNEIAEIEKRIKRSKQRFKDGRKNTDAFIAQSAVKIDWYVNKSHTYRPTGVKEKIKEIRYWCS